MTRDPEKTLRAFIKLGIGRSLPALAAKTGVPLQTLKRWSSLHGWQARAAAFDANPHRRAGQRLVVPAAVPSPASSAASYVAARAAAAAVYQRVRDREAAIAAEDARRAQEAEAARRATAPVPVPAAVHGDAAPKIEAAPALVLPLSVADFQRYTQRDPRWMRVGDLHWVARATGRSMAEVCARHRALWPDVARPPG